MLPLTRLLKKKLKVHTENILSARRDHESFPPVHNKSVGKIYRETQIFRTKTENPLRNPAHFDAWKVEKGMQILHPFANDTIASSLPQDDVLVEELYGEALACPRHYIAIDHTRKVLLVAVRGTANLSDVITDLAGEPTPFLDGMCAGTYICAFLCEVLLNAHGL